MATHATAARIACQAPRAARRTGRRLWSRCTRDPRYAEQHRATGIDISENQIELARRNVPEARFVQGDVMQIGFPSEAFDAIVAFYVIEHVPREEHADLFARWARWLRPGGHLLFTIEPHDEPGVVGDWLGAPMFFSHFDSQKTLMLMQGAGFILVDQAVEVQLEKDHDVAYMWVLAQLRETGL